MFKRDVNPVLNFYRSNPNYYHTTNHIMTMTHTLFEVYGYLRPMMDIDIHELFEAIMWHDAVYVPGNKNNEELSAKEYVQYMIKHGYSPDQYVVNLILSTKIKHIPQNDSEKLMHDLDWMNFGDYEKCYKAEKRIIKEAIDLTTMSKKEIKTKQLEFYKSLIGKQIFYTDAFNSLNNKAQENIKIRIKKLEKAIAQCKE